MDRGIWFAIVTACASLASFGVITRVAGRHFVNYGSRPPRGTIFIVAMAFISVGVFLRAVSTVPLVTPVPLVLYACSLALFAWTVHTTREMTFRPAFTDVVPDSLVTHGPYRFVRHPFYVSYLLYHLGNALATTSVLPWILLNAMFLIYLAAARNEEAYLAQGAHAEAQTAYKRRTGMFLPHIWRHR